MGIWDVFSKREKRRRGEMPDVYRYDVLPAKLRTQIVLIWDEVFGINKEEIFYDVNKTNEVFEKIRDIIRKEHGRLFLSKKANNDYSAVVEYFREADVEEALDVIEVTFMYVHDYVRKHPERFPASTSTAGEAIEELNERFREHGVGYQIESGKVVRVDSKYLHQEVVKPALTVLSAGGYEGANEEFLAAHEHYRKGEVKACLNECLKAFESVMKSVCARCGWEYDEDQDTASALIAKLFDHDLVPGYLQSHFTGLRTSLESGVPTIRNRESGHGQGTEAREVPQSIVSYVLHQTAANIVFLAQAESELD